MPVQRQWRRLLGGAQVEGPCTSIKAARGRVQTPGACCVPWSSCHASCRFRGQRGGCANVGFSQLLAIKSAKKRLAGMVSPVSLAASRQKAGASSLSTHDSPCFLCVQAGPGLGWRAIAPASIDFTVIIIIPCVDSSRIYQLIGSCFHVVYSFCDPESRRKNGIPWAPVRPPRWGRCH